MKTRKQMIKFLSEYFRYDTLHSWNRSTSYAARVKIRDFVPKDLQNAAYELLDCTEPYELINEILNEFAERHDYNYQIWFNGRSGGYLVLGHGGRKDSEYKSRCTACGQLSYKAVDGKKGICDKCNKKTRVNLKNPVYNIYTQPGKGLDMNEDFSDKDVWDLYSLQERFKLVKDFDETVERCKNIFLDCCKRGSHKETVHIPKQITVMNDGDD